MDRFIPLAAVVAALAAIPAAGLAAPKPEAKASCEAPPYDCAIAHIEKREFTAAVRLLEPLVQSEPRNLKALNLLGIALTGAGKREAANARFREALRIDPAFYPSLKNLAVNQFDAGKAAGAQRDFEAVLKLAPEDEIAHVYLGEIHFAAGRLRTALTHYERSRDRVFVNAGWTLRYGETLLRQGRTADAIAAFDRLPAGDAESRFQAGVVLGRAGAHADAARFFGAVRGTYREPYAAGYNQALMLVEAGDHDAATGVLEGMIAADAARAELHSLLSRANYGRGRIKDAYDALRTAARLEPETEEHYVDLAMICLDLENHDLGLEIVDVGLHYRPASSMLYLQRGALLAMKAQLGEAEKAFAMARELAPGSPTPHAALAMIWMQTGQTDKAVEMLRKESRTRRNDHIVPYTFAVALVRSGVDPAGPAAVEAIEALRASIRANGDFAPSRSQLGRLLLKRNDVEGAIRELERATALDPEATAALYNLGQAYIKKGDKARAAELLAKVSRLNAEERGDDPDGELKRTVVRIMKDGSALKPGPP
jgi:predicted Zn-dependent protease